MKHDDVITALRRIVRAIDLHSRSLEQRYGLTEPQLVLLRRLADGGQASSVGGLADAMVLSQPTVTGILARMERRGFVERRRSETDRRRVTVRVTDEGFDVLRRAPAPLQHRLVDRLERLEDWERNLILSSLERLGAMLEADDIDAAPILASGPLQAASGDLANRTPTTTTTTRGEVEQ